MSGEISLKAEYASPTESHIFEHSLPEISTNPHTEEKTAYLSSLRSSVVALQEDVNVFLTTKMDEDKALVAADGLKADERKEEENYGEEIVEEV